MLSRGPSAALRPFVRLLWASEPGEVASAEPGGSEWERMLPSGRAHVVLRLTGGPITLFDATRRGAPQVIRHAVVGGPRSSAYIKHLSHAETVGAELDTGATLALLGVPGRQLAEAHTPLEDVLCHAESWCDELHGLPSAAARVERFDALLSSKLRERALHPVVAHAIGRFTNGSAPSVSDVVRESGYSHRRFISLFEEATGITPKRFARVVRFGATLEALQRSAADAATLCAVAAQLGYADQAHLTREFREYTGITPARYQQAIPEQLFHLPLSEAPEFTGLQFGSSPASR